VTAPRWALISKISWRHAWKLALASAFPCGPEPFALFLSPVTVPIIFGLRVYQDYQVEKLLDALRRLNTICEKAGFPK
jgi:hypothetical protein